MHKKIVLLILVILTSFISCYEDGLLDIYEDSVVYNLRDRGPAGGWIFYINPNYRQDGWRYLEAASTGWSGTAGDPQGLWTSAAYQSTDCPGTSKAIGTGMVNTLAILQQNGNASCAAKLCRDYNGGGYNDWFLPSMDELVILCWNLYGRKYGPVQNPDLPVGGVGGFSADSYCSSSQNASDRAYYCYFVDPNPAGNNLKSVSPGAYVRPVRAF